MKTAAISLIFFCLVIAVNSAHKSQQQPQQHSCSGEFDGHALNGTCFAVSNWGVRSVRRASLMCSAIGGRLLDDAAVITSPAVLHFLTWRWMQLLDKSNAETQSYWLAHGNVTNSSDSSNCWSVQFDGFAFVVRNGSGCDLVNSTRRFVCQRKISFKQKWSQGMSGAADELKMLLQSIRRDYSGTGGFRSLLNSVKDTLAQAMQQQIGGQQPGGYSKGGYFGRMDT